jgi:hypothetical protein
MIAARGKEQQGLAHRVPAFIVAAQQKVTDRLGAGRAAGFARRIGRDPGADERRDEAGGLGRFAGPLPAFDGDESAGRQCREPQIR